MENSSARGQSALELVLILLVLTVFTVTASGFSLLSQKWLVSAQLSQETR